MADQTRDYLDHFARRIADVVTATVEARNDDDTYMVRTIAERALLRASKSNPVDEFALGSRVLVQLPAASRNSLGAAAVITSRAPREQRGLSSTSPTEERVSVGSAAMILSVTPDPLVLVAGGDPGEQVIVGHGLTGPAVYVGRAGGTDPDLTEEDPPIVTTEKVTMVISAAEASAVGVFDLEIGALRAAKAMEVRPAIIPPATPRIFVAATNGGAMLLEVDPETLDLIAGHAGSGNPAHGTRTLCEYDGAIYWTAAATSGSGGPAALMRTVINTGVTDVLAAALTLSNYSGSQIVAADVDGEILLVSGASTGGSPQIGIWTVALDGTGESRLYSLGIWAGIADAGTALIATSPVSGTIRVNKATGLSEASQPTFLSTRAAVMAASVAIPRLTTLRILALADLALIHTFNFSGANISDVVHVDGKLYSVDTTGKRILWADPVALTSGTLFTFDPAVIPAPWIASDGTALYVPAIGDKSVWKIGLDGSVIAHGPTLTAGSVSQIIATS